MLSKLAIGAAAVSSRLLHDEYNLDHLRGVDPLSIRVHPMVGSSQANCTTTVDRLKKGPANIPEVIHWGNNNSTYRWIDEDFQGKETLYQVPYVGNTNFQSTVDTNLNSGNYWFKSYTEQSPTTNIPIFKDNTATVDQVVQGEAGTCYLMSSLASVAEAPQVIKDVFLTDTKNSAGIIGVQFYIRGKPWAVSLDSSFLYMYPSTPTLKFAQVNMNDQAMWGPILEKAWAKVKGSYETADGGFVQTGLRAMTGVPVFSYLVSDVTTTALADAVWQTFEDAETNGYYAGAGTSGGSD